MTHVAGLLCVALAGSPGASSGGERVWSFEKGVAGLRSTGPESGVVPVPGEPANRVFRIVATRAHHTQLLVTGSEKLRDFELSCRVRVLEWTGAPPTVYMYGATGKGGMRLFSLSRQGCSLGCWYGKGERNAQLGSSHTGYEKGGPWVHMKVLCFNDGIWAKAWRAGSPEPAWQAEGVDPRDLSGACGVGLWTSPTTPSTAKAVYDDLHLRPVKRADLAHLGIQLGPRPALAAAQLGEKQGVFEAPGRTVVATRRTAVAFDAKTGEITNIVDRPSGREFVARQVKAPLFKLVLTQPFKGRRMEVTSRAFRSVRLTPDRDTLRIAFTRLPALGLAVHVSATAHDDGAVRLGLRVENKTDWCVAEAAFPQTPGSPALGGDAADDALLLPWSSGGLLPAPGATSNRRNVSYPGSAFAQFYAHYDPAAGLYAALADPGGHCKRFALRCTPERSVGITFHHQLPETPGTDVTLPYDVVLRTFKGDWRDAAAIYKAWAVKQPWCATKLTQRDDIPAFLKEGAGVIIEGLPRRGPHAAKAVQRVDRAPDLMDAYRKKTGLAHMIYIPYGWENRGTWAGVNYFPAIPSNEQWVRVNAELKRRGHRTAFLTSGFWWVTKRRETGSGLAFDDTADFQRRAAMCVHRADGAPWTVDWYERTRQFGSWRGLSAKLCHGSAEARATMKHIFLDVARLGVPLVSFDQEIGGAQQTPCYRREHGHAPGMGAWQWTGFRDLCRDILREGKPIQPELGLFLENVSELAIPYMATYWSRQFGQVEVGASGARGIGLFSYLYHEYVTAIGAACVQGQGYRGTRPHPGLTRTIFANNLVRGLIPGPFIHYVPVEGGARWQHEIAPAYFSYCRAYKPFAEYLMLGETVRPLAVECADADLYFWRRGGKDAKPRKKGGPPLAKQPFTLPAIATGCFRAADGSTAAFLANTTPARQAATVHVPADKRLVVYDADRKELERKRGVDSLTLELPALAVRVIVMR